MGLIIILIRGRKNRYYCPNFTNVKRGAERSSMTLSMSAQLVRHRFRPGMHILIFFFKLDYQFIVEDVTPGTARYKGVPTAKYGERGMKFHATSQCTRLPTSPPIHQPTNSLNSISVL